MQFLRYLLILPLTAALGACERAPEESPAAEPAEPQGGDQPNPEETATVSILRPDIERPDGKPVKPPLTAFRAIIGFPQGGTELDEPTKAILRRVMATQQMERGGPITLRSHSDSAGDDETNLQVSEERGLAVAKWLIERGVDADRITVIALGEQNPLQPNALPDGSPSPEGRAANRRVEIVIGLDAGTPAPAAPATSSRARTRD